VEDVGVRIKGAKSRCNFYNDILGIYNLFNMRISFNQTFDDSSDYGLDTRVWSSREERERRKKRTFATLETMELKWNQSADNSYVRNGYVHEVFRSYGIPSQQCRLTTLSLGGCKMGIYRLFEPVDERFIHRYFSRMDWGGDLYKAKGTQQSLATFRPYTTYGIVNKKKSEYYNYDLQTNTDTSSHESLRHLIEVVNRPGVTKEEIDGVIDTDWLTRFVALNFALGNMDDMRCNYNNYFVYFRQSDGKAVFIPYDCEIVMGAVYSWNTPGYGMTGLSPYFIDHFEFDISQDNPFVLQVISRGGYYNDLYNQYLLEAVHSKWFSPATFEAFYKPYADHYSDKVISKFNFMSTLHMNLDFSLEGGERYNGNLSVEEFMTKMRRNIEINVPSPSGG
jgi:Spore coat assembly protein